MTNLDRERFDQMMRHFAARLLQTTPVHIGEWQSKDVSKIKQYATYELLDTMIRFDPMPTQEVLTETVGTYVNLDWAEEHFQERVSGHPLNPPPSHERWPWNRHNGNHQEDVAHQFSHTYPERIWPKHAGNVRCHGGYTYGDPVYAVDQYGQADDGRQVCEGRSGIRFAYGDLWDVVDLLIRSPLTRQAYLPIWFPEDTGAAHRQRVPCTLGYHFMIRDSQLSCRYYIRSCDFVRHFADDIYLAVRLMQWVCAQWNTRSHGDARALDGSPQDPEGFQELTVGHMNMYISSLHAFEGDTYTLNQVVEHGKK